MKNDESFMQRALLLAARGEGVVEPNPCVGAVIVKKGKIIAEGRHKRYGGAHAEVEAIWNAKGSLKGSTLYVNLEPCSHYGKTPPCVDLIVRSGIGRVVAAMGDPNPLVNGKGFAALRKAGVNVVKGALKEAAMRLNAPFAKYIIQGIPYVYAKWAMTLDGKIATRTGDSRWISSDRSRMFARSFRDKVQAIIVGVNTVIADDPLLAPSHRSSRLPLRVILDTHGRLPLRSRIARSARDFPTMVVTSDRVARTRRLSLERLGCIILPLKRLTIGNVLRTIGNCGCQKVLIEGGGKVHASALEEKVVDEVMIFIAPKIVGGEKATTPVEGMGISHMEKSFRLSEMTVERFGEDILVRGRLRP